MTHVLVHLPYDRVIIYSASCQGLGFYLKTEYLQRLVPGIGIILKDRISTSPRVRDLDYTQRQNIYSASCQGLGLYSKTEYLHVRYIDTHN